jgi:hypothetical protein
MNDRIKRLSMYFKTCFSFTYFQLVTLNEQLESNIRVSRPEDSGTSGQKTETELRTETDSDTDTEKQLRVEISNLRANLLIAEEERESLSQENEKLKSLVVAQKL